MKTYKYAGLWARLAAYLIDRLCIAVLYAALALLFYLFSFLESFAFLLPLVGLFWLVGFFLSHWLYYAISESSSLQATFGMRLLGLAVIGSEGERISFGRATQRYFAKFLCYLTLGIGFLMIAFNKNKQGLHDRLSSTYVIWVARSQNPAQV